MRTWFFHPGSIAVSWLVWLLGGMRVHGLEHVPAGAFVLVSNHCSNLDPPIIGWAVGHRTRRVIHFMAKREMRSWPVAGWLAAQSGVFFVRRGEGDRAAQRQASALLRDGAAIGIFPEGTRSRNGRLKLGKAGAAFLAIRAGVPILPVGIAGTHRYFPGRSRLPRRSRAVIRVGSPFTLPQGPGNRLGRSALDAGLERIMSEIEALLPPEQRRATTATAPSRDG